MISTSALADFIVKAKIAGYATAGEGGESDRKDFAKELAFAEGDLQYIDRYYGFDSFAGIEVVWFQGTPIWSITYYGMVLSPAVPPIQIYGFLKDAMRLISSDRPFRGPSSFERGDFQYSDQSAGDFNCFTGVERICHQRQEVYRLTYNGGRIRLKGIA
jgi:hypothetical protein